MGITSGLRWLVRACPNVQVFGSRVDDGVRQGENFTRDRGTMSVKFLPSPVANRRRETHAWTLGLALCMGVVCVVCTGASLAQQPDAKAKVPSDVAITNDAARLLELGQLYMAENNPDYALKAPPPMDFKTRNEAGEQALRTFQQVTNLYPSNGDGWLWLGIVLTETLRYSEKAPNGEPARTESELAEGTRAFRTAYECKPDDLIYTTFYGDALMTFQQDFDGARKLWEDYLKIAKSDMQRVTALTQTARACLNKGYFGKMTKKMTTSEATVLFHAAENDVQHAEKICPNAPAVKEMTKLLQQYRSQLCGP